MAGGSVSVDGDVGDDLFVGALGVQTGVGSEVGRDVLVWARTAELLGRVGRDVEGTQSITRVAGTIVGDLDISASSLSLLPGLEVSGDVRYVSSSEATIAETATVSGVTTRVETLPPNLRVRAVRLLIGFVAAVAALGIGLAILWAVPRRSISATQAMVRAPLRSLGWGVGVASVPVALVIVTAGIVAVTSLSAAGPVVLVLLPVALGVASIVFLGLLTTSVPLSLAIGSRLRPGWSTYGRLVAGFPILVLIGLVPWIGGMVLFAAMLAGLGSWMVAEDSEG